MVRSDDDDDVGEESGEDAVMRFDFEPVSDNASTEVIEVTDGDDFNSTEGLTNNHSEGGFGPRRTRTRTSTPAATRNIGVQRHATRSPARTGVIRQIQIEIGPPPAKLAAQFKTVPTNDYVRAVLDRIISKHREDRFKIEYDDGRIGEVSIHKPGGVHPVFPFLRLVFSRLGLGSRYPVSP